MTLVMTRCPLLVDAVAAATSRDGLRQIDRHALDRRVEAHESTRGNQHQQHQRQVLDRRLTPLHAVHRMDATVTCAGRPVTSVQQRRSTAAFARVAR